MSMLIYTIRIVNVKEMIIQISANSKPDKVLMQINLWFWNVIINIHSIR